MPSPAAAAARSSRSPRLGKRSGVRNQACRAGYFSAASDSYTGGPAAPPHPRIVGEEAWRTQGARCERQPLPHNQIPGLVGGLAKRRHSGNRRALCQVLGLLSGASPFLPSLPVFKGGQPQWRRQASCGGAMLLAEATSLSGGAQLLLPRLRHQSRDERYLGGEQPHGASLQCEGDQLSMWRRPAPTRHQ